MATRKKNLKIKVNSETNSKSSKQKSSNGMSKVMGNHLEHNPMFLALSLFVIALSFAYVLNTSFGIDFDNPPFLKAITDSTQQQNYNATCTATSAAILKAQTDTKCCLVDNTTTCDAGNKTTGLYLRCTINGAPAIKSGTQGLCS